ncbi:hypothetical protein [uncultured Paraglaciecola sp.]|nr:hypothetical protein [uncultured Paraglaciecola sp.]
MADIVFFSIGVMFAILSASERDEDDRMSFGVAGLIFFMLWLIPS